jgi:hypothetical protein
MFNSSINPEKVCELSPTLCCLVKWVPKFRLTNFDVLPSAIILAKPFSGISSISPPLIMYLQIAIHSDGFNLLSAYSHRANQNHFVDIGRGGAGHGG